MHVLVSNKEEEMALSYTGVKTTSFDTGGTNYQAKDGTQAVSVQVSQEALQDQGESKALGKGSDKYGTGDYSQNGDVRIVTVRTTDF